MDRDVAANLKQLTDVYKASGISLFCGAGVSFTSADEYQTPGWWGLLERIHDEFSVPTDIAFKDLKLQYPDAWNMASYLDALAQQKGLALSVLIADVISTHVTTDKRYKRLPIKYLNKAATLNAVIAFCSSINHFNVHQCLRKNPLVHSIITLNYDCFVEAGATQKYNAMPFKPMSWHNAVVDSSKLPVYHIHGYLPFNRPPKRPIVLTRASYDEAYSESGYARKILTEIASNTPMLFLGISFEDEHLLKMLQALHEQSSQVHFAILKRSSEKDLAETLARVGIKAIYVDCFSEIPQILAQLYQSTLDSKIQVKGKSEPLSSEAYWNYLLANKK